MVEMLPNVKVYLRPVSGSSLALASDMLKLKSDKYNAVLGGAQVDCRALRTGTELSEELPNKNPT